MRTIICHCLLILFSAPALAADFNTELQEVGQKLEKLMPECETQITAGDLTGANAKLLAAFPDASKSAAQSFMLGNVLYEMDRKQSYALHKTAATLAPDNADILYEWALEQHRAGEYAGALATYEKYAAAKPTIAITYALEADCLLRLNRIKDAAEAWKKSEDAPRGDLETMESMVCAVHREPAPFQRRADLLAKATGKKDVETAMELIALDCDFPRDWWNGGPQPGYLAHDLEAVIKVLGLPDDDVRSRAIHCAAECAQADEENADAIRKTLEKHRLLIDKDQTIPSNGGLLSIIVPIAVRSKAIDSATLLKLHPKFLDLARKNKDERLWNVAAFSGAEQDAAVQMKIEREAWQATGHPRYAAAFLFMKSGGKPLKSDDPDLVAAAKQFPEDGRIQSLVVAAAMIENKVTLNMLATAAKAEFTHFSSFVAPATVIDRPRSDYLRNYFGQMFKITESQKKTL